MGQLLKHDIQWAAIDETTDGKVRFLTTVDIDASTVSAVPPDARNRMICLFVINHLSGKRLADARESLVDIFSWQREQAHSIPQVREQKRHTVSQVRRVEKVPFALDDD